MVDGVFRERWGTFSVRDHTSEVTDAPFVSDVLLFDRLVIPTPPEDASNSDFWDPLNLSVYRSASRYCRSRPTNTMG